MNKMTLMVAASVVAAMLAAGGCGSGSGGSSASGYVPKKPSSMPSGMVDPGQEATYFPFAVGSQWTFESQTSNMVSGSPATTRKQEVTYHLDSLAAGPQGGQDATFTVFTDGSPTNKEVWRVDPSGLYQVATGKKKLNPLTPPQLIVPFPATSGRTFSWTGTLIADTGEHRTSTMNGVVDGPEQIDTDLTTNLGTYNALAAHSSGTLKAADANTEMMAKVWLIPNVGIGRYRLEMKGALTDPKTKRSINFARIQLLKLKNYTLKK